MEAIVKAPSRTLIDVLGDFIRWLATVYTQDGEEQVTDFTTGDAAAPANYYIGWGTGTTPAAKGDSALETPGAEARVIGVETQPLADKAQWVATITSASTQTISECGLFDAITTGNLFIHSVFTGIDVNNGDKIEFTVTLEQT